MKINNMIITADWHIGAVNPNDFLDELEDTLFKKLDEMVEACETLDAIFVVGDIFDSKQYFASDAVSVAVHIFNRLMTEYADELKFDVYIVSGTRTHDAGQLDTLGEMIYRGPLDQDRMVFVINKVCEVTIGWGMKVLIIPEEYVADQDSYYDKYFQKHYDIILGHGMIDKIWYAKKNKEDYGENQIMSAPVFSLDQLLEVGEYSFFGHVHTHKLYAGGRFRYLGPVTRWEFGSSTEVGITYIEYDQDSKTLVKDEFIENLKAPYMPTRIINLMDAPEDGFHISDINVMIDDILVEEIANQASRIRFIVNLNSSLENANAIKDFLVTKLGDIPIAKLVLSADFDKDVVNSMKETMEIENKTLDYVFSRDICAEERIKKFIQTHRGKDVSIDKIKKYLEEDED